MLFIFISLAVFLMIVFSLRIMFEMWMMNRIARIALSYKLLKVALLSNGIALLIGTALYAIAPLYTSLHIFLQFIVMGGIEVPLYQIFYRNYSWSKLFLSLFIARLLLSLFAVIISCGIIYMMFGTLDVASFL